MHSTRRLARFRRLTVCVVIAGAASVAPAQPPMNSTNTEHGPSELDWQRLPDLPDELGVAGPFVGVHQGVVIVAGGANFARPVWESTKTWHDTIYVLETTPAGPQWITAGRLPRPLGYGAAVSIPDGVLCLGGNDAHGTYRDAFHLGWDAADRRLTRTEFPPLPQPCASGQAAVIGETVYLAGGQSGSTLDTALHNLWALDLTQRSNTSQLVWRELPPWPGPPRAFNITAAVHNGDDECVYVLSGRRQTAAGAEFLADLWEFNPRTSAWRRRSDAPRSFAAGAGIGWNKYQLIVLGGDDGRLFLQTDRLRDEHPGFPRDAWVYDARTDVWSPLGQTPQNHVTTIPVVHNGRIVIASGEIRPRVRTPAVWSVAPPPFRLDPHGVE